MIRRLVVAVVSVLLVTPLTATPVQGCEPYPITEHSPTGCVGDVAYGDGLASTWQGPGVARNDCIFPWTHCQTIVISSQETGKSVIVTPTMYCDCWRGLAPGTTGPQGETPRLVDLDPSTLNALGLSGPGLYSVRVEPVSGPLWLPNTAMQGGQP